LERKAEMTREFKCFYCSKTRSKAGRLFDGRTLDQHMLNAHGKKNGLLDMSIFSVPDGSSLEMAHLLADDESDGIFMALANEFNEW